MTWTSARSCAGVGWSATSADEPVERAVLEGIARHRPARPERRLQPGPAGRDRDRRRSSGGASRGSAARRRASARASTAGSASAPASSSRSSPRRSTTPATRRPTRSRTTARRSTGPCRTGGWTWAARSCSSCSPRSTRASRPDSPAPTPRATSRCEGAAGIPADFSPVGIIPVGRPLPDKRSPSLKRGWVAAGGVRPLGALVGRSRRGDRAVRPRPETVPPDEGRTIATGRTPPCRRTRMRSG